MGSNEFDFIYVGTPIRVLEGISLGDIVFVLKITFVGTPEGKSVLLVGASEG